MAAACSWHKYPGQKVSTLCVDPGLSLSNGPHDNLANAHVNLQFYRIRRDSLFLNKQIHKQQSVSVWILVN